jgi:ferredoxin-type protein NapF
MAGGMSQEINHARRGFLRGQFKSATPPPRRPPWALSEAEFIGKCTRCNNCAIICPTKIIVIQDGYPRVDFAVAGCTFCGECVRVCTPAALRRDEGAAPWSIKAHVNEKCLAQRGVECRICGEHCEVEAIRFPPRINAPPLPVIDATACTGCAACVSACPSQAVKLA